VLSEKPFASNADEARVVRDAATAAQVTVMEGFHYLYHPVTRRLHELLDSGELGELRAVEIDMFMPAPDEGDPRWSYELAGGVLMDLGCYSLHAHRGQPAGRSSTKQPINPSHRLSPSGWRPRTRTLEEQADDL
jgi:predicted dehydrogenase